MSKKRDVQKLQNKDTMNELLDSLTPVLQGNLAYMVRPASRLLQIRSPPAIFHLQLDFNTTLFSLVN